MIKKSGYTFIFTGACLWGSIGFFVTNLNAAGVTASTAAFLRLFFSMVILFLYLLFRHGIGYFKIDKTGIFACFILGVFAQGLFNFCYNNTIVMLGTSSASVLLYTAPAFVCLTAVWLFKEKMSVKKTVALLVNFLGCIFTVTGGVFDEITFSVVGVVFGILSGFLYSLITTVGKMYTDRYDPFLIVFYSFVFGTLTMFLISDPLEQLDVILTFQSIFWAVLLSVVATILPYLLYMYGMSKGVEASRAPIVASVEVVVASLFGFLLLFESVTAPKIFGISLVLASIVIMNINITKTTKIKD